MAGFAMAQEQTTTTTTVAPADTPAAAVSNCSPKNDCNRCCNTVLTKEERERFCAAKAAAIAADPTLADKKNKRALCQAIVKKDPSMQPIVMKLKKHCDETRMKKMIHSTTQDSKTPQQ